MVRKLDRTGEVNYNTYGSKMIIKEYRNKNSIDVYFPKYNWIKYNSAYKEFKNGYIKCPYEKSVYGVGYVGEGKYNIRENNKPTKCYRTWHSMLERCYNSNGSRYNRYGGRGVIVCEEWHNFQNFAKWYEENYYEINEEEMQLDKDILIKSNKIYSSQTCVFVPKRINTLFIKCDKTRGGFPIGVTYNKTERKYVSRCYSKTLGYYNTPEEAFQCYKQFKESYIKQIADEYKPYIPKKLYEAMYRWEVDIND